MFCVAIFISIVEGVQSSLCGLKLLPEDLCGVRDGISSCARRHSTFPYLLPQGPWCKEGPGDRSEKEWRESVTLCNSMDRRAPGFPVLHYLPEFTQTHVYWVSDAIQPCHRLPPPSPPALNLSQHQGLFQWVSSSHQVAKVLELQHQSFQWIFRVDFL